MSQPQNQTQNQLDKAFNDFASDHLQINSYQFGYEFEFATSGDTVFPQMFVRPLPHTYSNKVFQYNFRWIFADVVGHGERNRNEVLSDQLEIAKDAIAQFQHPDYAFILDPSSVRLEDFFDKFDEEVSGYLVEVAIRVPFDNNRCFIPTDGIGITVSADQNLVIITDANNVNSPISINAGGTYTCSATAATSDLTCQNLNDDLTQAQRDFIQHRSAAVSGQVTSFRTADDGDLETGIGGTASGITDDPFFVLPSCNNTFGNRFRFTDENGDYYEDSTGNGVPNLKVGTAYDNDYLIDHLTGLGWTREVLGNKIWNDAVDGAASYVHSLLSFSDFRLPTPLEILGLFNYELDTVLMWEPFGVTGSNAYWTGTTVQNDTARAYVGRTESNRNNGNLTAAVKASSFQQIYVRNHF